jgi:hypothetical protein
MRIGFLVLLVLTGMAPAKEPAYRAARAADGHPDLQGTWEQSNKTPLSRLDGFATLNISPEQAAVIEARMDAAMGDDLRTENLPPLTLQPVRGSYRSSIIVDPTNGRLPGTPAVNARIASVQNETLNAMDGPEQRPTSERCISNAANQAPILWLPGIHVHQIVQTGSTVLIASELMDDARVIRLNAKHAPAAVSSWLGDSIGWWEGDTLVVETTHFTPSARLRASPFSAYMISPATVVVERFTPVSPKQIDYRFTVTDPTLYLQPWSGETQFTRTAERLAEFACHEGNYSLTFILQGARVKDGTWPPANK